MRRLADTVNDRLGAVDILAAFAGGNGMPVPTVEETPGHWREVIDTDLTSTFLTVSAFLRPMVERRRGSIVTMSSAAGRQPARSNAAYAAAKAGVINYTKTAALELAPHGIRVNALAPDITLTEGIMQVAPPGSEERFGLTVPMGRAGHVDEMAGAAVFLASDMSSYITGQTIHVDGGTQAASGWYHHPKTGAYALGPSS